MNQNWPRLWGGIINAPLSSRLQKPRRIGHTMVMDKGMGLRETRELLETTENYFDYLKLAFGTPALYNLELLVEKISLVKSHGILIYPGGTFLEIAIMQDKLKDFLDISWDVGFSAIEVSDGTVRLSAYQRQKAICAAAEKGFVVLTEVGSKNPAEKTSVKEAVAQIKSDLEQGAVKVIMEARESGKGIGLFNDSGEIRDDYFNNLCTGLSEIDNIIWEAPHKNQQQQLILRLGPNVSLGNIPPAEVMSLEALRLGLRSDTLRPLVEKYLVGCYQC